MEVKVKMTCPLGSQCEKTVGEEIHRCVWFTQIDGVDPQSGDKISEKRCAISLIPLLQVDGNRMLHNVGGSIQSLRNETVKRQQDALEKIDGLQIPTNK